MSGVYIAFFNIKTLSGAGLWLAVTTTPAAAPELEHGEGGYGRRQRALEPQHLQAGRREYPSGVIGKVRRPVPGVMADDGAQPGPGRVVRPVQEGLVQQVASQAGGRPPDDRPVHAGRASSELAAQARRAEPQRVLETVPQPRLV